MACFQGKSGIGFYGNDYYIKNNFIQLADRLQKKVNRSNVPFDTKLPLKGAKMEKREMKEEFRKMLSELVGEEIDSINFKEDFEENGLSYDFVVSAIQAAQLKRIADVLEDINGTLIGMGGDIEALGDCVGVIPPRYTQGMEYKFLRIGGSVDTEV